MVEKGRRLGKGLDALLGDLATLTAVEPQKESQGQFVMLPTQNLQRGKYQPRRDISPDSIQELANSIRAQGIIQPIVVRKISANQYEIIAGERRWRAAQLAGLTEVPVVVKTVTDEVAMAMALIENIQREDLNPIEEAMALQRLLHEFEMTHQQIADAIGKSRTTVTNLLRLLGLHPEVKKFLEHGDIEMGHARAILGLEGALQLTAAYQVVSKELSVREAESLVRRMQLDSPAPAMKSTDPDIARFQTKISEQLGAAVVIMHTASGKGKLVIQYNSLEELEGILEHIK